MLKSVLKTLLGRNQRAGSSEISESFLRELKKTWLQELGIQTVLDLGANVGDWSQAALGAFPEAEIYAFEPLPLVYQKLTERFKGEKRFHAFDLAITDKEGLASFHQNEFSPSSSLLNMRQTHKDHFKFTSNEKSTEVKISKLDTVFENIPLKENILIKMDVQGSESNVIRGGAKTVSRAKVVILETSFETLYENEPLFDGIYKTMVNLGFKYHGQMGQLNSPVNSLPLQADCIFLRS